MFLNVSFVLSFSHNREKIASGKVNLSLRMNLICTQPSKVSLGESWVIRMGGLRDCFGGLLC